LKSKDIGLKSKDIGLMSDDIYTTSPHIGMWPKAINIRFYDMAFALITSATRTLAYRIELSYKFPPNLHCAQTRR